MKILSVTFNRNGSSPAPSFICALFTDGIDYPKEQFIATWVSKDDSHCLVDNDSIRVTNITRLDSCYRGDYFVSPLSCAIKEYCNNLGLSEVSISAACFPNQYKQKQEQL